MRYSEIAGNACSKKGAGLQMRFPLNSRKASALAAYKYRSGFRVKAADFLIFTAKDRVNRLLFRK